MSIRIHVDSRLPRIAGSLDEKLATAARRTAEEVRDEAKSRAPRRTGALADSIHVEFEGQGDYSVVAGNTDVFYGHMVEFGTTRAPAHPFLIPALERKRHEVDRIVRISLDL